MNWRDQKLGKASYLFRGVFRSVTGIQTTLAKEGIELSVSHIRSRIKKNTIDDRTKDRKKSPQQAQRKQATEARKREEMKQICITIDAEKARIGTLQ